MADPEKSIVLEVIPIRKKYGKWLLLDLTSLMALLLRLANRLLRAKSKTKAFYLEVRLPVLSTPERKQVMT